MSPEFEILSKTMGGLISSAIDTAYETLMMHPEYRALSENQRIGIIQHLILRANMRYLSKMPYTMDTNSQIDEVLKSTSEMISPTDIRKIIEGIEKL